MFPIRVQLALVLLLAHAAVAQTPTGAVSGSALDGQTGRPIPGVTVAIDGQSSNANVTDSDGKFTIKLSPGTYTLRFTAPNYAPVDLTDVSVKAGETTDASTLLTNKSTVTTIDVVEKVGVVDATAEAMLNERKLSSVVSDSIGREELSAGASSDAAGALQKVTGVSVVGSGFVYVRGLGERYSSTQLNGALIPTTEPEKRVVPLDLFPAGMIESIKILKTYSPDLPAEFSGGLVQMQTIEFPTQKVFNVSIKNGFNTATTFNKFLTYPGGSGDYFGFGAGSRGIPSVVPANARLFPGQFTRQQLQSFGQAFSNNWEPTQQNSARPAMDWSAVGGGTFGRFGIVGAVSFTNKPQLQSELQRYLRQGVGAPVIFTEYKDYREYSEEARMGAVFNTAVRLTPNQKINFRNTFTHDSEKTAREFSGYDGGVDTFLSSQRLRYIERSLFSTGVEGEHSIQKWRNSLIHWQFTYSNSKRDEPDLREVIRNLLPNGLYRFSASGSSGVRFFSDLADRIFEPQADYSIPFFKGSVSGLFKTGVRVTVRQRDFAARRFLYAPQQFTSLNLLLPSNQLFAASNIRPNGFQITEFTRGTDTYSAEMKIFAGYSMVDISFGSRWRIEGGIRFEDADQSVLTFDNRVPNAVPVKAGLHNRDPAPAINAIYSLSKRQNLRLSYSRTVSRPDFRELSPFDFNNVLGGFVATGNPNLKRALINSYDARWEFFPGGNQLIAISFFAKKFANPIEQTILPSNDLRQTFVNAKGARNLGLELEYRRSLASFSRRLREFSLSANFTFVDSNIEIQPEDATIVTSQSRPLLGQSRYIANAMIQWRRPKWRSDAKFYTNYVSRRISDVGTFTLPDIYQEANTMLDFVYQYAIDEKAKWNIRFEAENLGDTDYRWTQGNIVQRDYRLGRTFQIGLNYSFF
ncbi:MAG TPA: TonB-dependent receptor [Bryobacteraceae bacterium]|nr:TonB-dependent receptor [Bryobacteraceae bacterium]